MTDAALPLLNLSVDPRARLVLFDIADDPLYAAMEVQVFDDAGQGRGVLVLLARHDGKVEVYRQPQLTVKRRRFSVGRGIDEWREAVIDPATVEIHPDGIVVAVGLEDAGGRRIEVRIDDRDGVPRTPSTLLAPVSSGVETPEQLLVVLLEDFDLVRTGGSMPRLSIGGVARTIKPFPGPEALHHRRFIRYAGAPLIVALNEACDGPVDPAALGPVSRLEAGTPSRPVVVRFEPALPGPAALAPDRPAAGSWSLDVASEPELISGTWAAARTGDRVALDMAVTRPWRPHNLPRSLRLVTTVARVFRQWPLTYRWHAEIDLAPPAPTARAGWTRVTGPDRQNAYAVPRLTMGRVVLPLAVGLAGLGIAAMVIRAVRGTGRGRG